jgi:hypothetical protein
LQIFFLNEENSGGTYRNTETGERFSSGERAQLGEKFLEIFWYSCGNIN